MINYNYREYKTRIKFFYSIYHSGELVYSFTMEVLLLAILSYHESDSVVKSET